MSTCPHPEKAAHRSMSAAITAREKLEADRGIDLTLTPYRCVCGSWHIGHRHKNRAPKWVGRKTRKAIGR